MAKDLKVKMKCYMLKALQSSIKSNAIHSFQNLLQKDFEHNARNIRYDFFHKLIITRDYHNLITAHHFDDRLEWFFMQLSCGAGLNTLLGFNDITERMIHNKVYYLVRPFITYTKQEILNYNHTNNIKYFIDTSNSDTSYKRNLFRQQLSGLMNRDFVNGIKKSFAYLEKERARLYPHVMVCVDYNLFICKSHIHEIHTIDMLAKRLGYIMSGKQKDELQRTLLKNGACVMGSKIVIAKNKSFIFVGIEIKWLIKAFLEKRREKYIQLPCNIKHLYNLIQKDSIKIPKQEREKYRIQNIPPKIRPLLYINSLDIWENNFVFI